MMRKNFLIPLIVVMPLAIAPLHSLAEVYPNKPVTIVVTYPTGGATDNAIRIISEPLRHKLGQSIVVLNKPGAGTIIGTEFVSRAPKDGYTLLLATPTTFAINSSLRKNLNYSADDFVAVGGVSLVPYSLVVTNKVPAKNIREFSDWAKNRPQGFTYGTNGKGGTSHINGAVLSEALGIKGVPIHYKGGSSVQVDLISGRIDASIEPVSSAIALHNAGRAKILGIIDTKRWESIPNIPTLEEQGFKQTIGPAWLAIFAPNGTPNAVVEKLSAAIRSVVESTEVIEKLKNSGMSPLPLGPKELKEMSDNDIKWWAKVIVDNAITLDAGE